MPVLSATLGQEETQLSTQLFYVLVMLTSGPVWSGPALAKYHNVGLSASRS